MEPEPPGAAFFCLEPTQVGRSRSRSRLLNLGHPEPEPPQKVAAPQHCCLLCKIVLPVVFYIFYKNNLTIFEAKINCSLKKIISSFYRVSLKLYLPSLWTHFKNFFWRKRYTLPFVQGWDLDPYLFSPLDPDPDNHSISGSGSKRVQLKNNFVKNAPKLVIIVIFLQFDE